MPLERETDVGANDNDAEGPHQNRHDSRRDSRQDSPSDPVRRRLLQAAAASAALAAIGCTGDAERPASSSRSPAGTGAREGSAGAATSGGGGGRGSAGDRGGGGGQGRRSGSGSSPSQSATAAPTPGASPGRPDWRALERSIDGDVIRPFAPAFDEAHRLFDPRFDDVAPTAVVEVASADDVAEAVAFARRFGLRIRPRSGGHSYVGASTTDRGLVIDVRRLRRVAYDPGSRTAAVGAGVGSYPLHTALARHGRSVPTGTCPTVGVAGLTLGGGLGVDNRAYGLTCDALVGLTLVTADGQVRQVDDRRHRDLFWASRGGGGGNLGVVTSLRYRTHRARPTGFFLLTFPWEGAAAVLRGWARRAETMPRSSWANLHLDASSDGSTVVRVVGVCAAGDEDAEAAAMQRVVGLDATDVSTFTRSFLGGVTFLGGGSTSSRVSFAAGSDVLAAMPDRLAERLPQVVARRARSGGAAAVILDPLTGAVRDRRPGATAFPWRRHLATVQWYVGLPTGAPPALVRDTRQWIDSAHRSVDDWSVGGYVNYLEPGRPLSAYYGARRLARLRRVRRTVDPGGVFSSPYSY